MAKESNSYNSGHVDALLKSAPVHPDSGPATLPELIDCEARMPKPLDPTALVAVVKRINKVGEVALPANGGWEADLMRSYKTRLESVTAGHKALTVHQDGEANGKEEGANGSKKKIELQIGTKGMATVMQVARGRFLIVRFDLGGNRTERVHIAWEGVRGVAVKEAAAVRVKITRLPNKGDGEQSYGGVLLNS